MKIFSFNGGTTFEESLGILILVKSLMRTSFDSTDWLTVEIERCALEDTPWRNG